MDDWKLEDPSLLEFNLNECSTRELCEIFALPFRDARGLYEYRMESLHVFKFDQLLKLKGIEEEMIQRWTKPQPDPNFDRELQTRLNLDANAPQPLPKLLEAVCQTTNASGCLMAARDSGILFQSFKDGLPFEKIARELPAFVRPVQDDMIQMKLGITDVQVIGFESCDLIFLPASGFYLGAMLPTGSINPQSLSLWRSLALEIRRRFPAKIFISNHAKILTDDIVFDCPRCALRIVVDRAGVGYGFPCPRCKTQVTVPAETTSFSSFVEPADNPATAAT